MPEPARQRIVPDLLLLAAIWCVAVAVAEPHGNFPLNDDWSFALTVRHFLESGDFRPTGWAAMPMLTNVLWGALFCLPNECSFDALRLSTQVMGLVGAIATYGLLRMLNRSRTLALFAALVLGLNPIYFALANSFMTDVPFVAISLVATVFFVRCLQRDSTVDLAIATAIAIVATLSRQLAIALPAAFAVVALLQRRPGLGNLLRALLPFIVCAGMLALFDRWLGDSGRMPALYHDKSDRLIANLHNPRLPVLVATNLYVALLYLGWFLAPVLPFSMAAVWRSCRKPLVTFLPAFLALLVVMVAGFDLLIGWGRLMPLSKNIVVESGIGPLLLRDTYILKLRSVPVLPTVFWQGVTIVGMVGASAVAVCTLAVRLLPGRKMQGGATGSAVWLFLLLTAAAYLLPLLVAGFFDRYLLFVMPLLVAAMSIGWTEQAAASRRAPVARTSVAAIFMVALAAYGVLGTHDTLAWNRARWSLLQGLMDTGRAGPRDIDGGFEFNGLYLYDPAKPMNSGSGKPSWWWVERDEYVVAFGAIPGYEVVGRRPFTRWLPPSDGEVLLLRRTN